MPAPYCDADNGKMLFRMYICMLMRFAVFYFIVTLTTATEIRAKKVYNALLFLGYD